MESLNNIDSFLEMIDRPAFFVQDGIITKLNQIAKNRYIKVGAKIEKMLPKESPEYNTFTQGCLHLTVFIGRVPCHTTVIRYPEGDIFLMERNFDRIQLQTLALSAQQLRVPLSNIMTLTDDLLPQLMESEDETVRYQAKHINQGLFQLVRLLANMADAERYFGMEDPLSDVVNLPWFFNGIMEKAAVTMEEAGMRLVYTPYVGRRFGLADREKLERAALNMLSNAAKFSPKGSVIEASVSIDGDRLRFTVRDHGDGIASQVWGTLYARYQREPAIEDSRFGVGLGMTLIHAAAAVHGGTVLVEQPEDGGTRVTMTIRITKAPANILRTSNMRISSYTGGWDTSLVEFSDLLPSDSFDHNA